MMEMAPALWPVFSRPDRTIEMEPSSFNVVSGFKGTTMLVSAFQAPLVGLVTLHCSRQKSAAVLLKGCSMQCQLPVYSSFFQLLSLKFIHSSIRSVEVFKCEQINTVGESSSSLYVSQNSLKIS